MSVHKECGKQVRWGKRSDDPDRYMQPLEFAGFYYILDESGTALEVVAYQIHQCNVDDVRAITATREALADSRNRSEKLQLTVQEEYAAARESNREDLWKQVLPFACEGCGAKKNERCTHKLSGEEIRYPHTDRIKKSMERKRK